MYVGSSWIILPALSCLHLSTQTHHGPTHSHCICIMYMYLSVLWSCASMFVSLCLSAILFVLSCPVLLCWPVNPSLIWLSKLGVNAFRVGSFEADGQPDLTASLLWAFVLSLTVDSKYSTVIGREPVGFQATHNSFCLVIWTCSKLRAGPSCNEFELDVIWSGDDKEMKMLWYCQLLLVSYQC